MFVCLFIYFGLLYFIIRLRFSLCMCVCVRVPFAAFVCVNSVYVVFFAERNHVDVMHETETQRKSWLRHHSLGRAECSS